MNARYFGLGLLGLALAVGCANPAPAQEQRLGSTKQKIVNGQVSVAAQDATVMIVDQGKPGCTGTLIAPNLVLTARHCVATPSSEEEECSGYGKAFSATTLSISTGVNASASSTVAKGKKIFLPKTSNMCSFDVALIQLDKNVPNAKIAKVRFSDLAPNEKTIAVGYGVDENDQELSQRMQRDAIILGVGPKAIDYKTKDNKSLKYSIPDGDVATGESTCFGDSGGPLFDMQGAIVAITSRGIPDSPQGGIHGSNGCADAPSIFAGVKHNEAVIRETATALGITLQIADAPAPEPTGEETGADVEPQSDDSDDEEESSTSKDKKSKDKDSDDDEDEKAPRMVQTSGCNASSHAGNGSACVLIAVALLAMRKRRRS